MHGTTKPFPCSSWQLSADLFNSIRACGKRSCAAQQRAGEGERGKKTQSVTNAAGEFRLTREVKSSEREQRLKNERQSRKTLRGRRKAVSEDEDEGHVLPAWTQILLLGLLHQALRPDRPVSVVYLVF